MSKNIFQVYQDNPIVTNQATDLMYFGRAPYGLGDDTAMQFSDFAAQFGSPFTPSALTKTDDSNVTLTLGGTPATALLQAVSLTLGWTGQLSVARGGTGASSFIPFSVVCGGTTSGGALQSVVGLGAAGEQLTSNGPGALPTWQAGTVITPAAMTKTDDTNVTLTLGGSPSTSLLAATSLTLGWTGLLSPARGGTGINNGTNTLTLGGNLTTSGAFSSTFTMTAATNVTFPTSGTLATVAGTVSSITGTANQVIASSSTGAVTLSLPQSIATTSAVSFASVQFTGNNGLIDSNGNKILSLNPQSGAVNYIQVQNGSTGNGPNFQAVGSDPNVILQLTGQGNGGVQVQASAAGGSVGAGYVGYFVSSVIPFASAISISNNAAKNLTSITISAGDWDIYGNIYFNPTGIASNALCWISSTSATVPDASLVNGISGSAIGATAISAPFFQISVSSNTTIYLSGFLAFSTGTVNMCGGLYARIRR